MRIYVFDWDDHNINHIARHRVSPDEAEEIFQSRHIFLRGRHERYTAFGVTEEGRCLICIFERGSPPGTARIITARDMSQRERKYYRKNVR